METLSNSMIHKFKFVVLLFVSACLYSYATLPAGISANAFYKKGYLDVSLYDVHNTDITIATAAIQTAVSDAQANKLVCYFPSGNYIINSTIEGLMPMTWNTNVNDYTTDRREPVYIVGANPRPTITLKANSSGFNDPANPKPMFLISAYSKSDNIYRSNIAFNLVFRNIDLDLNGSTNTGAVGLDFVGAQGSTIEDVKVTATNAYSGFLGAPGQGGGTYNVEVIGGQHAWDLYDDESRFVTLVGITCTDQTAEIIRINPSQRTQRPILITGFSFKKANTDPVITSWPTAGGISLVDGIIEYTGSTASYALPVPANNLYIKNVYFKKCNFIVSGSTGSALIPINWTQVLDYRYTGTNGACLIDGQTIGANTYHLAKTDNVPQPVAATITGKHIVWDSSDFISIENANDPDFIDVVNDVAKMAAFGGVIKANDASDDYQKLQDVINSYNKVFLPKGTYYISQPLVLGSNTQLLGAGKTYTVIRPVTSSWNSPTNKTMITTVADAGATTSMSFLMLETDPDIYQDMSRITWLAGRNSMIRDVMIGATLSSTTIGSIDHHLLKLSGSTAGGHFYGFTAENNAIKKITGNANYRAVKIDNTKEPIRFYAYNSERIYSTIQFEIKNSSDVEIYYLKSEANASDGQALPLSISNSDNVRLFCLSGNINIVNNRGLVEVNTSTNVFVSTIKSSQIASGCFNLKEVQGTSTYTVAYDKNMNVFHRIGLPTASFKQYLCTGATIADLMANGTEIKWWDSLTNGNQYTNLATVLVNNQHYYVSQTVFGNTSARVDVIAKINAPPSIITQPVSSSIPVGAKAYVSVEATNVATYKWQYQLSGTWIDVDDNIPTGAAYNNTQATENLVINGLSVGTHLYRCITTSNCGVNVISDTVTITTDAVTSISKITNNNLSLFNVFPNPSTGICELTMKDVGQNAKYEVFTIDGKVLCNGDIIDGKSTLNLTNVQSGMYILKLIDELAGDMRKMIIIQH
ncbi:MAG: T9SS type A sorting domain-containing protein [Bacteroidetes bacterium]|nr:T9SS type A sorting domain-containing protein [Bacteroidota bacterium]